MMSFDKCDSVMPFHLCTNNINLSEKIVLAENVYGVRFFFQILLRLMLNCWQICLDIFIFFPLNLLFMCHPDVQTLEELSLSVLSRLEEVVKEQQRWREIAKAHIQLLRDFALQEWLCSQNLEHIYHM